jgi:hypothetical protein
MTLASLIRRTSLSNTSPIPRLLAACVPTLYTLTSFHGYYGNTFVPKAFYWQEVIRTTLSPSDSSTIYEDPSKAAQRSMRAQNAEGLLRRKKFTQQRHVKKWMEKQQKKREVIFKSKKRGVDELRNYLKFKVDSDAMWKLQKSKSRALDGSRDYE